MSKFFTEESDERVAIKLKSMIRNAKDGITQKDSVDQSWFAKLQKPEKDVPRVHSTNRARLQELEAEVKRKQAKLCKHGMDV